MLFQGGRVSIDKKAAYSFDTELDPLQDQDLLDLATAKRLFTGKTADSNLDMNGFQITNLLPATSSQGAVTLGQLSSH